MDLEEHEDRNDCAGAENQQSNRPTDRQPSVFRSECLSTNTEISLYNVPIKPIMAYCPTLGGRSPLETAAAAQQSSPRYRKKKLKN
jgi:hypothetical protein